MITIDKFKNIKNPRYSNFQQSSIDITCDIEGVGESIDFTASLNDSAQYGRELYDKAKNGEYGEVSAFIKQESNDTVME